MFIYLVLQFGLIGDGVTTTWAINLKTDPYFIAPPSAGVMVQRDFNPKTKLPVGIFATAGPTETLSGDTLTITYAVPPSAGPFTVGAIAEYAP